MSRLLTTLLTIVGLLNWSASAQLAANPNCPNTLAIYNPNLRTACSNSSTPSLLPPLLFGPPFPFSALAPMSPLPIDPANSLTSQTAWFIIPITKTALQPLVPFPLLPLPTSDRTLFPSGFPAGKHPILVSSGYMNDIRMADLQIAALKSGSIIVPYVDRLKDGKTGFNYPLQNYIGGPQNDVQAVVPTLVGTAEGTNLMVATITPLDNAYAPISSNPNEFSTEVKSVILPNTVSGPAIMPEAFDLDFITAKSPLYTNHTFHLLVNQPQILTNTMCQRNTYYFNNTFTGEVLRSGNATLVPPLAGSVPKELGGVYTAQGGYSASGEIVGYNAETCASAAANLDKSALI